MQYDPAKYLQKYALLPRPKLFAKGMFGRVFRYRGICGGRTEYSEVSGNGIEVVPGLI